MNVETMDEMAAYYAEGERLDAELAEREATEQAGDEETEPADWDEPSSVYEVLGLDDYDDYQDSLAEARYERMIYGE